MRPDCYAWWTFDGNFVAVASSNDAVPSSVGLVVAITRFDEPAVLLGTQLRISRFCLLAHEAYPALSSDLPYPSSLTRIGLPLRGFAFDLLQTVIIFVLRIHGPVVSLPIRHCDSRTVVLSVFLDGAGHLPVASAQMYLLLIRCRMSPFLEAVDATIAPKSSLSWCIAALKLCSGYQFDGLDACCVSAYVVDVVDRALRYTVCLLLCMADG